MLEKYLKGRCSTIEFATQAKVATKLNVSHRSRRSQTKRKRHQMDLSESEAESSPVKHSKKTDPLNQPGTKKRCAKVDLSESETSNFGSDTEEDSLDAKQVSQKRNVAASTAGRIQSCESHLNALCAQAQ